MTMVIDRENERVRFRTLEKEALIEIILNLRVAMAEIVNYEPLAEEMDDPLRWGLGERM